MKIISRRQFLYFSALSILINRFPFAIAATKESFIEKPGPYPLTIAVLKDAYLTEIVAYKYYVSYCQKAIDEKYPNIAYLFTSFSISEKTHADNYRRLLKTLRQEIEEPEIDVEILDTKSNLGNASEKELLKINKTYPDFLTRLEKESYDQAVINCVYSWKSHQQHEKKISEIKRYSGFFFNSLAKSIEGMKMDFHVCDICGSTIDEPPKFPCAICNYPLSHYRKVIRPS
jgi:rubrerythrin